MEPDTHTNNAYYRSGCKSSNFGYIAADSLQIGWKNHRTWHAYLTIQVLPEGSRHTDMLRRSAIAKSSSHPGASTIEPLNNH